MTSTRRSRLTRAVALAGSAALVGAAVALSVPQPAIAALVDVPCTGSPSDAGMINAAIAGSNSGDEIVFSGTCLINQTITLLANRTYRGESRTGTVLVQADGAELDAILAAETYLENYPWSGEPIAIRSLTIDGNRQHNSAPTTGLILRSWLTVVEDLLVHRLGGHGIMFVNQSADGTELTNTSVNGRIAGNMVTNVGGHGIYVNEPAEIGFSLSDWNLLDNWVGGVGRSGIYLANAAGWVIERNHVYDVTEHGIFADRLWGSSLSDNFVESFGQTSQAGTWYGVGATVQGWAASTIAGNRVMMVDSDELAGSTYRYLGIERVNYSVGVVSVTGNAIHGAGTARGTGLHYALGPGEALNVHSSGNIVNNVGTALVTDGSPVNVVFSDSGYLAGGTADCTSVVTGSHTGPLVVTEGVVCLEGATVTGPVQIEAGAGFRTASSQVTGPLTAHGASEVTLLATRFTGPVQITDTAGPTVISGNTITGTLACAGNDPAPVNDGAPNQVTGPQTGQCKDL